MSKFTENKQKIINEVNKPIKVRSYSTAICDLFENILNDNNIIIPDDDRTGDESEACLYGMTYSNLEEDITRLLVKLIDEVKMNPEKEIDSINL